MPACVICNRIQGRLNKGDLCRECKIKSRNLSNDGNTIEQENNNTLDNPFIDDIVSHERSIIDLIKDSMAQEKERMLELNNILKEQIIHLKEEINHKNLIIERLIPAANIKHNTDNDCSSLSDNTIYDVNDAISNNTSPKLNIPNSDFLDWHAVKHRKVNKSSTVTVAEPKDITSPNRYRYLITDDSTTDLQDNNIELISQDNSNIRQSGKFRNSRKISEKSKINNYPQNDKIQYKNKQHVPGNSTYSNMTITGRRILILSDSIAKRIIMKELNKHIIHGNATRKTYIGATPKELLHYCTFSLENIKPDAVIINIGTNSINKENSYEITSDIVNIVKKCQELGVNDVFVSSITHRPHYTDKINETNQLLQENQFLYQYNFIDNSNIISDHVWKDNVHLNDRGTEILARNFIRAVNAVCSA